MKKTILCTAVLAIMAFVSCGDLAMGPAIESKDAMKQLVESFNKEFATDVAIDQIFLCYDKTEGNTLSVRYNLNKSKIIEEKEYKTGVWYQLEKDTMDADVENPAEYLFGKNDFDLNKIPDLSADAKARFEKEKSKDGKVYYATVSLPIEDNVKKSDLQYKIVLESSVKDSLYDYIYDLNGKFLKVEASKQEE